MVKYSQEQFGSILQTKWSCKGARDMWDMSVELELELELEELEELEEEG
jgi:hypothetical protein